MSFLSKEMNYFINLDKNIIYCSLNGIILIDDLLRFIRTIRSDVRFHNGLNTISDIRNAKLPKGFLDMNTLTEFVEACLVQRSKFKLALITSDESTDSANLFKALSNKSLVRECFTIEDAETWVTSYSIS